jgi:hypothetical protein
VDNVLRQQKWTEEELIAADFKLYYPTKRLVMARILPDVKNIEITLETLVARKGDIICYTPGHVVHQNLDDYDHWPVRYDLFRQTYRQWDEPDWKANLAENHLMQHGCRPFYKASGVWAKRLHKGVYVQSLESRDPVLVPPGRWLCIGTEGEPYNMNDVNFRTRYIVPPETLTERIVWRVISGLANLRNS